MEKFMLKSDIATPVVGKLMKYLTLSILNDRWKQTKSKILKNWYCTTTKEKYKNVVNKDGIDNQKVIPVDRWKNKLSQLELFLYIYFF